MSLFRLILAGFLSSGLASELPSSEPLCISKQEAEKILGKVAQQTEGSSEEKDGITVNRCTWSSEAEPGSNRSSNLYFLVELYRDADVAHRAYAEILSQNRNIPGQNSFAIGDEGWIHSDQENFHLVMVRKGNKILRIKVNKVTVTTSMKELQKIAADLAATF